MTNWGLCPSQGTQSVDHTRGPRAGTVVKTQASHLLPQAGPWAQCILFLLVPPTVGAEKTSLLQRARQNVTTGNFHTA